MSEMSENHCLCYFSLFMEKIINMNFFIYIGSLPCLLCLRCMRDTCIPEEKMIRDPRRLYAPGRLYHIVERKPFRYGQRNETELLPYAELKLCFCKSYSLDSAIFILTVWHMSILLFIA